MTPGTLPITPPTGGQSQEILGASCWDQLHCVSLAHSLATPICQKRYLRTLLWTAILLSPSHPGFTKTPGFPRFNHCMNLCLSPTPLTDGQVPSLEPGTQAAWAVDLMKTMLAYKSLFPRLQLFGEWRLEGARMRLHLVGPHMHGVQYGANSARSGHGAPAICQHALTPQLQPFLAGQPPCLFSPDACPPHQRTPVVLSHEGLQRIPVSPCNNSNHFPQHSVCCPSPLSSPSSLLVVEQGSGSASSGSRKSS